MLDEELDLFCGTAIDQARLKTTPREKSTWIDIINIWCFLARHFRFTDKPIQKSLATFSISLLFIWVCGLTVVATSARTITTKIGKDDDLTHPAPASRHCNTIATMAKKKQSSASGGKSKRKRSLSTEDEELPPPPAEEPPMHDDEDDSDAAASASEEEVEEEEEEEVLSEESGDEEEEQTAPAPVPVPVQNFKSDGRYHNKQRCLTLCSRGVTARYRHLLEDLRTLIPHSKKESKLDPGKTGSDLGGGMAKAINDIAEMRSCSTVLFLECRKRMDAYLWVGRAGPSATGPSVKFEVSNVHTMDELRLTGNCMKGSRPVLTFDESFDRLDELRVIKELFVDVFGCPRGHPKSKPFVDRVMGFYYADGKVCAATQLNCRVFNVCINCRLCECQCVYD